MQTTWKCTCGMEFDSAEAWEEHQRTAHPAPPPVTTSFVDLLPGANYIPIPRSPWVVFTFSDHLGHFPENRGLRAALSATNIALMGVCADPDNPGTIIRACNGMIYHARESLDELLAQ